MGLSKTTAPHPHHAPISRLSEHVLSVVERVEQQLRPELQRHLQLIEWLVREWKFDEVTEDRDELRNLANGENGEMEQTRPGKHTKSYGNWPIEIVDLPESTYYILL